MTRYRIINAIFWLYLWLSDVMQPVVSEGDFWSEKATQLLRLNQNFDDPPRLIGNAIIPVVLWFVIDLWLRRKRKRVELSKKKKTIGPTPSGACPFSSINGDRKSALPGKKSPKRPTA
jgi:hypothetical protein